MQWFGADQNGARDRIRFGLIDGAGTEDTDTATSVRRKFRPVEVRQMVFSCSCQFNGRT